MEAWKRETYGWLAASSLCIKQRIVKVFDCTHVLMGVGANKSGTIERFRRHRPGGSSGIPSFFSSLHGASPQLAKSVIARRERIVLKALSISQRAIIQQPFDNRFHTV